MQGTWMGGLLFAVGLLHPRLALAGMVCVAAAYAVATLLHQSQSFLANPAHIYNPLLVGFSVGALYTLSVPSIFLSAAAGGLTYIVTAVLSHRFAAGLNLPVLSLPFVVVSSVVYLASGSFGQLGTVGAHLSIVDIPLLPHALAAFFRAFGSLLFMPYVAVGLVITLLLLRSSRILFFLACIGFFVGTQLTHWFGSAHPALGDPNGFNYMLVAMAIGGIYLVPSWQSLVIAVVGVVICWLVMAAVVVLGSVYALPVFTLPFVLVTLVLVYLLQITQYRLRPTLFKSSPEETLDYYLQTRARFTDQIPIRPPFSGRWTVWQGFDGKWTHQGAWKYAYDFVITDDNGATFTEDGARLHNYFCYQKAVLSPVAGYVVSVVTHFPDNPIGTVDTVNNWGNLIILRDIQGHFVLICHLSPSSIMVKEGDWVDYDAYLGLCGNSGYSPQPHVHIQVQASAAYGAPTLPYTFAHYVKENTYHAYGLPAEGQTIEGPATGPFQDQLTTFVLDDEHLYEVYKNDKKIDDFRFKVTMALDGTFYFSTDKAKLYFGKRDGTFYCLHMDGNDTYLACLFLAMPKLPLCFAPDMAWTDYIPTSVFLHGWKKLFGTLANLLFIMESIATYQFHSETEVTGHIRNTWFREYRNTRISLDPVIQIKFFSCGEFEFRRVMQ